MICIYCKEVFTRFIIFCFILNILFTSIPTWENFELSQWPSLNNFVYLVGLHQIKNYKHLQRLTH